MGANAQTSVLDFTNGQVLTGPQMDISAGTGVPVFATTVTRDAAFGGVNKVLAEGQTCYLESTNVVQFYDGAAWATVGPAAAGALVRIVGGALSGGSTAFASAFSTTYDAYQIVVSNVVTSASAPHVHLTFGSATTGYYFASPTISFAAGHEGYNVGSNTSSFTYIFNGISSGTGVGGVINVVNPFLARQTLVAATTIQVAYGGPYSGYLGDTTSYTAFTLTSGTGTFTSGTVNVYGYSLS